MSEARPGVDVPQPLVGLRNAAWEASEAGDPRASVLWQNLIHACNKAGLPVQRLLDVAVEPFGATALRRLLALGDASSLMAVVPALAQGSYNESMYIWQYGDSGWQLDASAIDTATQSEAIPTRRLIMRFWPGRDKSQCHCDPDRDTGPHYSYYIGGWRNNRFDGPGCLHVPHWRPFEGRFESLSRSSGPLRSFYGVREAAGCYCELFISASDGRFSYMTSQYSAPMKAVMARVELLEDVFISSGV